jgi:hypothetical protein
MFVVGLTGVRFLVRLTFIALHTYCHTITSSLTLHFLPSHHFLFVLTSCSLLHHCSGWYPSAFALWDELLDSVEKNANVSVHVRAAVHLQDICRIPVEF